MLSSKKEVSDNLIKKEEDISRGSEGCALNRRKRLWGYGFLIFFAVASLVTVSFIFSNSLKNGEESMEQSDKVTEKIIEIVDPDHVVPREKMDFGVRKTAHFTEFCIFGVCIGGMIASLLFLFKKYFLPSGLFVILSTAVTDEFIQSFTERTSAATDVLIDFTGGILGVALICMIYMFVLWFASDKRQKKDGA